MSNNVNEPVDTSIADKALNNKMEKILDLQHRYDDQYDKTAGAELRIEDIRKRIQAIRSEQISGENVYQLLLVFDELYGEMDEPGKRSSCGQSSSGLKSAKTAVGSVISCLDGWPFSPQHAE